MNIQDRIVAARQAVKGAYQDFNQAEMGSPDFFAFFSNWNRLNSELNSLEKVQNLITADAFAGIGVEAVSRGIDRIFSTGIQYAPSLITAQSIQNAANSAMFGQGVLDTLSNTLDFAQAAIPSNMSDNYVPYGGAGSGFPNFNDDNVSSNYDQSGSGVDNFSSSDPKDYSGQFDGNSNAQTSNDNGTLIDNGASYSSIMSGDYLGGAESNSDNSANYGDCTQKSIRASDTVNNGAANSNDGLPETYQNGVPTGSTVESMNTYTRSQPGTSTGGDFSDDNFGRNTQDSSYANPSANSVSQGYPNNPKEGSSIKNLFSDKTEDSDIYLTKQLCRVGLRVVLKRIKDGSEIRQYGTIDEIIPNFGIYVLFDDVRDRMNLFGNGRYRYEFKSMDKMAHEKSKTWKLCPAGST